MGKIKFRNGNYWSRVKYVFFLVFGFVYCFLCFFCVELLWLVVVKCEENKKDYVEVDGVK